MCCACCAAESGEYSGELVDTSEAAMNPRREGRGLEERHEATFSGGSPGDAGRGKDGDPELLLAKRLRGASLDDRGAARRG